MIQIKDLDSRALILAFFAFFVDFLRNIVRKVVITTFLPQMATFGTQPRPGNSTVSAKKAGIKARESKSLI